MTVQRPFRAVTMASILGLVAMSLAVMGEAVSADDYIWTQTTWGSTAYTRNYTTMANPYGGYYVQRSAFANNYQISRPILTPPTYVVPTTTTYYVTQPSVVTVAPTPLYVVPTQTVYYVPTQTTLVQTVTTVPMLRTGPTPIVSNPTPLTPSPATANSAVVPARTLK